MDKMKEQVLDNCPADIDHVVEMYLSGDLPEAEMDAFEDHYFSCPACTERLKRQQQVMDQVATASKTLFPEDVRTIEAANTRPAGQPELPQKDGGYRWVLNAVAAILLIGLTWYMYDPLGNRGPGDFSENFQENTMLEQQMAMVSRDQSRIEILSPVPDARFTNEAPRFHWKFSGDQQLLTLTILDNKARVITRRSDIAPPYQLSQKLAPGLYYWTLDSATETLYASRFSIRR